MANSEHDNLPSFPAAPRRQSGGCSYILVLLFIVAVAMVLGGMAGVGP